MVKKGLIFIVMILIFVVLILCFVGWNRVDYKNKMEKKTAKIDIPEKLEQVRIVAIEEKHIPPTHKAKKRKKKSDVKKKPHPAPKKFIVEKERQRIAPNKLKKKKPGKKMLFPARFQLNNSMIVKGLKLIDNNSSVPIVMASYDRIGFESYLKKMRDIGGRLFVGDAKKQIILAEVILDNRYGKYSFIRLDERKKDDLEGMALFRPREITGEALVNEILNYSWQFSKGSDLRCVILLPLDKEAAILGALKDYLNLCGYHISKFDIVWGNYFQAGEQFGLRVENGRISKTNEIVGLDMTLTM